jgi:hypothetical protein
MRSTTLHPWVTKPSHYLTYLKLLKLLRCGILLKHWLHYQVRPNHELVIDVVSQFLVRVVIPHGSQHRLSSLVVEEEDLSSIEEVNALNVYKY